MRRACIDIGSNTTRLLVADCDGKQLLPLREDRAYTRLGQGLEHDGGLSEAKLREVSEVVGRQLALARELEAGEVLGVATAAIRRAANGEALVALIEDEHGLLVRVLSGEAEARLAFLGAACTLGHHPAGTLGVVDVGGASSEIVVGRPPDAMSWFRSLRLGSGELTDRCLRSDPPRRAELEHARHEVDVALGGVQPPRPVEAVAVGGSASSLRRVAGPLLDVEAFSRALRLLGSERAVDLARRFGLDPVRVRLLPAGLLILQAVSECFGAALLIGRGGLREGVLLEAS